ncbi:hypothetical protein BRADI_1g64001v3 [Brachypodium distachyon]|uniref:Aquaporin n=1 Tax=Brachypodium distachyon TaxID=15368 RepID=A0A2K2DTB9_BRADI|nr:hypothetical protein BRADI_1g64001v3 [Brachypodium distachyon]
MAWLTYAMRQLTQPETGVEGGQTHQPRIWTTVKSLRGKIKPIRSWRLKSELGQEFKVLGAVLGVTVIQEAFPKVGKGAVLSVGVHHGALVEGLATLMVVMMSVTLKKKEMNGFFMKTWISSIWKNTIHILSSHITGGIMNPASIVLELLNMVPMEFALQGWFSSDIL